MHFKKESRMTIEIAQASIEHCAPISTMIGELLEEIATRADVQAFSFNREASCGLLQNFIADDNYVVFFTRDSSANAYAGFVTLCESRSIYAGGTFGTIPELYIRPAYRRRGIGRMLLDAARFHAEQRGWKRLEVTTPPLPAFDKTLAFYEREGFTITGGRKLKISL